MVSNFSFVVFLSCPFTDPLTFYRLYCKHSVKDFATPEEELLYFLKRMRQPGWKWPLIRTPVPPEIYASLYSQNVSNRSNSAFEKDRYYCKCWQRNLQKETIHI